MLLLLLVLVKCSSAQTTTTFAGPATGSASGAVNGVGTSATFNIPVGVDFNSAGTLFVGDSANNKIRAISPAGVVTTFAGSGTIGFANGVGVVASFYYPSDVAVSVTTGIIYVADNGNNAIRAISPTGAVSTFAGGTAGFKGGVGVSCGAKTRWTCISSSRLDPSPPLPTPPLHLHLRQMPNLMALLDSQ